MELKGFARITLAPGETQTVRFAIDRDSLAFINSRLERVTEPGDIQVMVGSASDDIRLRGQFRLE